MKPGSLEEQLEEALDHYGFYKGQDNKSLAALLHSDIQEIVSIILPVAIAYAQSQSKAAVVEALEKLLTTARKGYMQNPAAKELVQKVNAVVNVRTIKEAIEEAKKLTKEKL